MRKFCDLPVTAACTVAVLAAVWLLAPVPEFMSEKGRWILRALLHPLFHANPFHLAVNCLVAWSMLARRDRRGWLSLLIGYPLAVLGFAAATRPVVGFSNVLCAIMGIRTPGFRHPWWREGRVMVSLASLVALSLLPGMSAATHMASFVLGALFTRVWDLARKKGNG